MATKLQLQAEQIFLSLLETPLEERPHRLAAEVGENEPLRRQVEALLARHEEAGSFLESPLLPRPVAIEEAWGEPATLGPYRILSSLGSGGMGTVYLAERDEPYHQRVAVKVLRHEIATEEGIKRFENERQILASLTHPHIARLLDGGTTSAGVPYLAMEYVEGEPIDVYSRRQRLSIEERIRLFCKTCLAVQALHRHLIVHRDLKPKNILITRDGEPRVIDFGIAKLLSSDPHLHESLTRHGSQPLTPLFASPEQVKNQPITTASDVYSLGVLLYLLLTDCLPYACDSTRADLVIRAICDEEPERPSVRVARSAAQDLSPALPADGTNSPAPEAVPASRTREHQRRLVRRLSGDLDSIVQKALQKRPEDRYGSVEQLAEDLRRHLDGRTVLARAGAWRYRLKKFLFRRRYTLGVIVLISLLLVVALAGWLSAVRDRDLANQERYRAEKISAFMQDLFRAAGPDAAQGEDLKVRDLLARGQEQLREEIAEAPGIQADLAGSLAEVYEEFGLYEGARELFTQAVELRRRQYGGPHPELAKEINNLAGVLYRLGDLAGAEATFREVVEMRRSLGQDPAALVITLNNLAAILSFRGRFEEAEALYREGLDLRLELHGADSEEVASSLYGLGAHFFNAGDLDRAEESLRRALTLRERLLGREHTQVATVLSTLGRVLLEQGRLEEAEEVHRRALSIRRHLLGENHTDVALSARDLAAVLVARGDLATAHAMLVDALATHQEKTPEGSFWIASTESVLGACLAGLGRYEEAEDRLLRSYEVIAKIRGPYSVYTRQAARRLVDLYTALGEPEKAQPFTALEALPAAAPSRP